MKRILLYIFMHSLLFPSLLELYGTGERYNHVSVAGIGLGDSYFFSDNISKYNSASISTFWRTNLTKVSFSTNLSTNLSGQNDNDINVSSFSFTFPVAKNKNFSLGLHPYTRSDIIVIESGGYSIGQNTSSFLNSGLNSTSVYGINGGISSIYSILSMRINNALSIGIKFNSLFGNQNKVNTVSISNLQLSSEVLDEYEFTDQDSVMQVILNKYSGYSMQIDAMIESGNHTIGASATVMGPMNVNFKSYYDLYSVYDPIQRYLQGDYSFINIESSSDLLPYETYYERDINEEISFSELFSNFTSRINDYSVGYNFSNSDFGIILEYRSLNQFINPVFNEDEISIFNNVQPSISSFHLGYYKRVFSSRVGLINSLNLRFGGYYKDISLSNAGALDIAATFGIGIGINNNSDLFGLGVKFGRIEFLELNYDNDSNFDEYIEEYIKATISIEIGEQWFLRTGSRK